MTRLTPVIAVLVAILLALFYTRPLYMGEVTETRAKIASYDAALAAAERFNQKEAELTAARAAISEESLERLAAFLPDGVDNVQLILDMDALAARSGVTLSNFDIASGESSGGGTSPTQTSAPAGGVAPVDTGIGGLALAADAGPVDSVDLTLSASGTYSAFRTFLGGLEQSLRPLDVINLSVEESNTGVYTYDMTIRIYWLR